MKKYLLPQTGSFYKANLHVHTTLSDGPMSPKDTKAVYMNAGYSVLAFTDHNVIAPHNELSDENFLAINAVEIDISEKRYKDWKMNRLYHFNLYSKDPNRSESFSYKKSYAIRNVNRVIAKAKKEGFLVCYNHPVWSKQFYEDYAPLRGLWGVENYNTGCVLCGDEDTMQPIDDLWRQGETVFPVSTDDTHSEADLFGGWIDIKAESLKYETIMSALERGNFYSSTGPKIHELWIDDGILHIRCSQAIAINLFSERIFGKRIVANEGEALTFATFDLREYLSKLKEETPRYMPYIRLTVIDSHGNRAHTRGYTAHELMQ